MIPIFKRVTDHQLAIQFSILFTALLSILSLLNFPLLARASYLDHFTSTSLSITLTILVAYEEEKITLVEGFKQRG